MRVPTTRRLTIAATVLAVAASAAACGSAGVDTRPAASGSTVEIHTFMFNPNPVRVPSGTRVTWTNTDQILHTVTSGRRDHPDGRFDGQLDGAGSTFSYRFTDPGTYEYHCSRHPGMDAVVIVN